MEFEEDDEEHWSTRYNTHRSEYELASFTKDYNNRYTEYIEWVDQNGLQANMLHEFIIQSYPMRLTCDTIDDVAYKIWLVTPFLSS